MNLSDTGKAGVADLRNTSRFVVVGANQRSSSAATREALFLEEGDLKSTLAELRAAGLDQAVMVSTCDRIEVHAAHPDPERISSAIVSVLAERAGIAADALAAETYTLADEQAVRHIFAVAASLDSLVIGEPQVLGQVKDSHRLSIEAGMTGAELESLLQAAYGAAKRVRTETAIGQHPVSLASAAVGVAGDVHGDFARCGGLLVAGGEMGELIARSLITAGLGRLMVSAQITARAEMVARGIGCHHVPFEGLPGALTDADIVISSVGTGRYLLGLDIVSDALDRRRCKPMLLIDAAAPGDIDPAVERLDGAFLYDLEDLEGVAMLGRASRDAAADDAWRILDEEIAAYSSGRAARAAVPVLSELRERFESERAQVLEDAGTADADRATRLLINRLLHAPSQALREMAGARELDQAAGHNVDRLVRRLFGLDRPIGAARGPVKGLAKRLGGCEEDES